MAFSELAMKRAHSPAARKKAAISVRKTWAAKRAAAMEKGGTVTTFSAASLPPKPKTGPEKVSRHPRLTDAQKIRAIAKIKADLARGKSIKAACQAAGITDNSYYAWSKDKRLKARSPSALNGHNAVQITLTIAGEPVVTVSVDDARQLQAGLNALLRS